MLPIPAPQNSASSDPSTSDADGNDRNAAMLLDDDSKFHDQHVHGGDDVNDFKDDESGCGHDSFLAVIGDDRMDTSTDDDDELDHAAATESDSNVFDIFAHLMVPAHAVEVFEDAAGPPITTAISGSYSLSAEQEQLRAWLQTTQISTQSLDWLLRMLSQPGFNLRSLPKDYAACRTLIDSISTPCVPTATHKVHRVTRRNKSSRLALASTEIVTNANDSLNAYGVCFVRADSSLSQTVHRC